MGGLMLDAWCSAFGVRCSVFGVYCTIQNSELSWFSLIADDRLLLDAWCPMQYVVVSYELELLVDCLRFDIRCRMLLGVRSQEITRWLLFTACCLLPTVYWLLFTGYCLLFTACWLLFTGYCPWQWTMNDKPRNPITPLQKCPSLVFIPIKL